MKPIVRLVVLMVEMEHPEGISSRKLILEAARHNVLTAYSGDDAVNLLQRFSNVDLAIIHTEMQGKEFGSTVRRLKEMRSNLYIVAISPRASGKLEGVFLATIRRNSWSFSRSASRQQPPTRTRVQSDLVAV